MNWCNFCKIKISQTFDSPYRPDGHGAYGADEISNSTESFLAACHRIGSLIYKQESAPSAPIWGGRSRIQTQLWLRTFGRAWGRKKALRSQFANCAPLVFIEKIWCFNFRSRLRKVKMDQRKLMDNANTITDMAKVSFDVNKSIQFKYSNCIACL